MIKDIKIGTKYKDRLTGRIYTVEEIYTITDSKGQIVRKFCKAASEFGGIPVVNGDVSFSTVQRNILD